MLENLEFGLEVCQEYNSLGPAQHQGLSFEGRALGPPDPQPRLRRIFPG